MTDEKTIKAIWVRFNPLSACSVGDTEQIPETRFKELEAKGYVTKANVEAKKEKTEEK